MKNIYFVFPVDKTIQINLLDLDWFDSVLYVKVSEL